MATAEEVLKNELHFLWFDLGNNINFAANGTWSIACETSVMRIIWASQAVGMLRWQAIQMPLLTGGIYNAVREKAGLEPVDFRSSPDWKPEYDELYSAKPQHAETVRRISEMIIEELDNEGKAEE